VRFLNTSLAIAVAIVGIFLVTILNSASASASTSTSPHGRNTCRSISRQSVRHERKLRLRKLRRGCRAGARAAHSRTRHKPRPVAGVKASGATGLARASTIAKVLATPCQYTELMPEPGNLELIRASVLCLINRERAENGETPLQLSGQLEQAAEAHSREMVSEDYFQHVSPTGKTPVDRIRTTGYIPGPEVGFVIGENLAWGTLDLATPQAIVEAWLASPKHLANILEAQYHDTGIGVAPTVPAALADGQPGATYAQEFGVIIR
jgi:uncharacterized protein YkwD